MKIFRLTCLVMALLSFLVICLVALALATTEESWLNRFAIFVLEPISGGGVLLAGYLLFAIVMFVIALAAWLLAAGSVRLSRGDKRSGERDA